MTIITVLFVIMNIVLIIKTGNITKTLNEILGNEYIICVIRDNEETCYKHVVDNG